ncbi:hypothetical protein DV735_g5786, partial [Chaetothyriales sp. CBS 134920]
MVDSFGSETSFESMIPVPTSASGSSGHPRKMKLVYFSNESPHDDLQDLFRRLYNHSKDSRHPVLAKFINDATLAVSEELRQLPTQMTRLADPFETVLELADRPELRKGPLCGSVEGVLLSVVELAALIAFYEKSPEKFVVDASDTCLAGLGIGLLSSVALSLAPTIADLAVTGVEVVRIAFRLGVVVTEVSHNLEQRDTSAAADSWAYVVADVAAAEVQDELEAIQAAERTPEASKLFISSLNQSSVTVSGPPSRLKALFRHSDFFRDLKSIALPVYGGLCHASHLYSRQNVQSIVLTSSTELLNSRFSPVIPVLSSSSGKAFTATSPTELFEQVIFEILTKKIEWDHVITGAVDLASAMGAAECKVFVFRISLPIHDLLGAMRAEPHKFDTTTDEIIPCTAKPSVDRSLPGEKRQSKIAIVGMSCRMPGGSTDTEKFWQLLENGLDVHQKIPADRFDVETHYDPDGKRVNTSHTPYGCFINEPGLFDAPFFNMSPREAEQTDPMQRLALVTAYEALERAGYVANRTPATNLHRIGTFYGQASDDYREVNTAQEISTYFIPGGCRAFGPGRINCFFKFSGPSFSCDTSSSSSLAAIQAACTSLWNGETDTVVAGGMNILTNSDVFAGLSHGGFLSKTANACKTWDAEADGYCRADGVGSVVMKRLEDAEADNDNILGVILAAATNHSTEGSSITHPHAGAQAYLYRQVMTKAGVDPLDVSFIEMHGTGTQAGDMVEITSITEVFAPILRRRSSRQPLYIGAVKANVGHGEAAAGVTALLKVLLMLQKNVIPPHVGIKNNLNPAFPNDLNERNLRIPYEKQEWRQVPGKKRVAVVNNFSAAGGNTTIAIEEAPARERYGTDPRSFHVVAISAKSKVSMKRNLERMLTFLETNPEVNLSDLSYSTTARRHHHNHRLSVATADLEQLRTQLSASLSKIDSLKPIPAIEAPNIAFTFTGEGSSHKSMKIELFHDSPYFKKQMLQLDSLAQAQGFPSFIPAIDGSHPQDYRLSLVITQLALVCTEIALSRYWESLGVQPNIVIGHSAGEYAALHVAGVISANEAVYLVGQRAKLLQKRCQIGSHKMMAVYASLSEIQAKTQNLPVEVACLNGPKDTVLSGTKDQIEAVKKHLELGGLKCIELDVTSAFHSAQTDPILDEFEDLATTGVIFRTPNLPIISPLLGKVVFNKAVNANYLRRATRGCVNFLSALEDADRLGLIDQTTAWVEIGPHPVNLGFVKSTFPSVSTAVPSLRCGENSWSSIAQSLSVLHNAGLPINWIEFHRPFEKSLRLLDLPTYAWNDENHWIMYNGDWAVTKGNTFYDAEKGITSRHTFPVVKSSLKTSTVQQIVEEKIQGSSGYVVMRSDLMHPEFLAAANGHRMNGCGVVTSSIHADIAYTLGKYLHEKLSYSTKDIHMNIANLEVLKGLVARKQVDQAQLIQVSIATADIHSGVADLQWHNFQPDGTVEEPFASANLYYGDANEWLASWEPRTHLVLGRIEDLEAMAIKGTANRLAHKMAYELFANNLVDYAEKYRGMQSLVINGLEAYADVKLSTDKSGTWTVPPFFIDSVCHLAGFIMNVSDEIDTKANFCVTPGWKTMRFAGPLVAGAKYRSYTKMIPTPQDPSVYLGDVYILQDDTIIGMVGSIKFCRYPRGLLSRFFNAPDDGKTESLTAAPVQTEHVPQQVSTRPAEIVKKVTVDANSSSPAPITSQGTGSKAIALIAKETALGIDDLTDDATFAGLGVDSLMSLVLAEKFREELGVTVGGSSLFLDYPTIGDLREWLEEYYS